jgi:hypothetical protein
MNFPATPTDLFHIPSNFKGDVQIFHANNQSAINFQPWIKPRGVSMSYIVCIGGGGGGGGAHSSNSGTNGGGGGGGACSGISRLIVPTFLLPDTLYVQVGVGGLGGAATVAGGAGTNSHVLFSPLTFAAANSLISSNTNAPGGGGSGAAASVGAAGTVPTLATATVEASIGVFSATVGLVGVTGGAVGGGNGSDVTAWITAGGVVSLPLSPGAGGAGANTTNFNGGNQTPGLAVNFQNVNYSTTLGSIATGGTGGTTSANIGGAGVSLFGPFFQSGGAGGGSNTAGVGGDGGRGGIGCGGGGGGKGVTGGRGGNGGNGLVAIFSW